MTLLELVDAAAGRLDTAGVSFGHGTNNSHDEAVWLVLWSLGLPLDSELGAHDAPLSDAQQSRAMELVDERIQSRRPAAYLTGEAWLQGIPFTVDERVIIPRSLIAELLVDGSLDSWLHPDTRHVLDLCTGNGSLGIIAAMVYPEVQVLGTDLSADALAVALLNVQRHALQERVSLLQSDGLAAVRGPFDLIVCNPPYVNAQSMASLPAEYRAEPAMALDGNCAGGIDGMDFIRSLLQKAPSVMSPNAILVLEIGNERENFEAAFPALDVVWMDTSAGGDQVLLVTREALRA